MNGCSTVSCTMKYTTQGKGPVVWVTPNCQMMLSKPDYASLFIWDGMSAAKWADGSEQQPVCLPALREGSINEVQYVIGVTSGGCLYKIAVTTPEVELCPEDPGDPPLIGRILFVPNAV